MYFPDDMNFQYFFFSTYPGFFLQALPIALTAGLIFVLRRRKHSGGPLVRDLVPALFVCYLTGLLCLTLFLDLMGVLYYFLFYHMPSGRSIRWFSWEFDLIPTLSLADREQLGNLLMFFPFGLLHPLFRPRSSWGRTVGTGLALCLSIELLQPVFGRSFDVNDIIWNSLAILLSATLFYAVKGLAGRAVSR